jgi:hypothetical protein
MQQSLFRQLRTLVAFEVDCFERRLRNLRSAHYPSEIAIRFIDGLKTELETQRARINQCVEDYSLDPKHQGENLKSQHRLLTEKLTYINCLERAQTQEVPWSLVPSIERLAATLLPGKQLLTTCTHDFNYSIHWYRTPKSAIQQFLVLELPAIHKTNALLHILVGHELLHPLLEDFFKRETPQVAARLKTACEAMSSSGVPEALRNQPLGELVETARDIWQRALEELMCDMGCAAIFGPAALFASIAFVVGSDLDDCPSAVGAFYPPPRFRIRQVLRYAFDEECADNAWWEPTNPERNNSQEIPNKLSPLQRLSELLGKQNFPWAMRILREHMRVIGEEVRKKTDLDLIAKNPLVCLAYKEVKGSLATAWEYVRDTVQSTGVGWLETIEEVPELLRSLERLVPPGEIRDRDNAHHTRAAPLSAISIAAWLYQLNQEVRAGSDPEGDLLTSYHRLCRLMLKAFEDVELKREYGKCKEMWVAREAGQNP